MHGPVEEILAAVRLRELEAALVGGRAGFLNDRANGVDAPVVHVLEKDRAVAGELELDRVRVLALDQDLFTDDAQWLEAVLPANEVLVLRVQRLHVDVHHVRSREGEAPSHALVVARVHTDEWRLASTRHVPSRSDEVDEVA